MKHRNARLIGVLAVLLWAALLWQAPSAPRPAAGPREVADAAGPGGEAPDLPNEPTSSAVSVSDRSHPAPFAMPSLRKSALIADVSVDKPVVCPGEDFLVSIRPREGAGSSELAIADLRFNIGERFGRSIALTAREPGLSQHTVVASNGVDQIEYRPFSVEVRQADDPACQERAGVSVAVERSAYEASTALARVTGTTGLEGALHYLFDFGDGTIIESDEPTAEHSYALRDQVGGISSYVVKVRAIDVRGREALGRTSFHLSNNHYRARAFGDRLVPITYERFPHRTQGGGFGVELQLRSLEPHDVLFERATITERSCLAGRQDRVHTVSAAAIGVPRRVGPRELRSVALEIPRSFVSDEVCVLELELSGDTNPRLVGRPMDERTKIPYRPVVARLRLELSTAPPVELGGAPELASRMVTEPALLAELQQATEALGRRHVTGQDLASLRAELAGASE